MSCSASRFPFADADQCRSNAARVSGSRMFSLLCVHLNQKSDLCWPLLLAGDELLAAVDVEGRAGNRRVRHEVNGQCGDVGRADDASDRQRRAELLAARVQLVAEE